MAFSTSIAMTDFFVFNSVYMINRHSRRGWSTSLLSKPSQVESLLFMPPFPILEPKNVKISTDIHIAYMYTPRDGNTWEGREG